MLLRKVTFAYFPRPPVLNFGTKPEVLPVPRPLTHVKISVWFDPGTAYESAVAPKSNFIELGSVHERSGVWIGPYSQVFSRNKILRSQFEKNLQFKQHKKRTLVEPLW